MRGFYMDEAFTGSPSDLQHISHDTNFTAKQWVDNTSASLAPIEATSTASQPYTVGKRLVYGGRLYKVTQAIAQGGTLTPGTNIASDSVDSELDTINARLSVHIDTPHQQSVHTYYGHHHIVDVSNMFLSSGQDIRGLFGITNTLPTVAFWTQVERAGSTPIMASISTEGTIRFMDLALANSIESASIYGHFVFISAN